MATRLGVLVSVVLALAVRSASQSPDPQNDRPWNGTVGEHDKTLRVAAHSLDRDIGVVLDLGREELNHGSLNILKNHFSVVQPEGACSFRTVSPVLNGEMNFTECDALLAMAQGNKQELRVHALVSRDHLPDWLFGLTADELRQAIKAHVRGMVEHYQDQVLWWDVVDRALIDDLSGHLQIVSPWYPAVREYVQLAFHVARNHVSDHAKLFYSDSVTYSDANGDFFHKADGIHQFVTTLRENGTPVDGVALQVELVAGQGIRMQKLIANLQRFEQAGLEVHLTNVTVACGPACDEKKLQEQATLYAQLTQACLQVAACKLLVVGGIADRPAVGERDKLFDQNYQIKAAGRAMLSAFFINAQARKANTTVLIKERKMSVFSPIPETATDVAEMARALPREELSFETTLVVPTSVSNAHLVSNGVLKGHLTGLLTFDSVRDETWVQGYYLMFARSQAKDSVFGSPPGFAFIPKTGESVTNYTLQDVPVPPGANFILIFTDTTNFAPLPCPLAINLHSDLEPLPRPIEGASVPAQRFAYPIVLLHGALSSRTMMQGMALFLIENIPGVQYVRNLETNAEDVTNLYSFEGFMSLHQQVEKMCKTLKEDDNLRGGFNAVGFSRGGILLRAYVEQCNDPPVKTLMTIASPHNGLFNTELDGDEFPTPLSSAILKSARPFGGMFKPINYTDPAENYFELNPFLSDLNNEHTINDKYRQNMLSLDAFVMIRFDHEEIVPATSGHFGWVNASGHLIDMEMTREYKENVLGLRSLNLQGKLHRLFLPCKHGEGTSYQCYSLLKEYEGESYIEYLSKDPSATTAERADTYASISHVISVDSPNTWRKPAPLTGPTANSPHELHKLFLHLPVEEEGQEHARGAHNSTALARGRLHHKLSSELMSLLERNKEAKRRKITFRQGP